jgi:hypothetical protein
MDDKQLAELLKKYPTTLHGDDGKTVITCVARLSFVHFKEPRKQEGSDQKPRYDCAVILPAASDHTPLMNAARKAWSESEVSKKREKPRATPLKKQSDAGDYEGFGEDGFYFNCATVNVPELFNIDMTKAPVDKFYSGCWARVKVRAYAFDKNGNWGVSFGLQGVQFFADDEKLGGGGNASDGFEAAAPAGSGPAKMPNGSAGACAEW